MKNLSWLFVIPLCFGLVTSAAAESRLKRDHKWLTQRLEALADDPRIAPAKVGFEVLDSRGGRVLAQRAGDQPFNIASNVKLITAAATLALLGPEFKVKTQLLIAEREGRVVPGDLYLKGAGDPGLEHQGLWELANVLYDRGIRRIKGRLVIDESYFDRQLIAPLFDERSTDKWYRPASGALSIHRNAVSILVEAGEGDGSPARVLLAPRSSYFKVESKVLTHAKLRRSWVKIETSPTRTQTVIKVRGRVGLKYKGRWERRRIEHPGLLAGQTMLDLLLRRGIRLGQRPLTHGEVPKGCREIATHLSDPLAVLLRQMNKRSDNFMAEQLIKILGAEVYGKPGTWAKGLKAVRQYLATLGLKSGTFVMKNGSGLYEATRFSPHQLNKVLLTVSSDFKIGPELVASLPLAGADGTLKRRLINSGAARYVRAKTGTLARVVALSGFAGSSKTRAPLIFSIFINQLPKGRIKAARAVADDMAAAMVTYLEGR